MRAPETAIKSIRSKLAAWYRAQGRDLPWRRTKDPYRIWVSEIMLQQTQVATALPYYERWLERFPNAEALAAATDQDVLSAWQGLGYYRRCENLRKAARQIAESGFPQTYAEWLAVPGVGRYTAAAIASICLNERIGVVDGNVERVFARLTGSRETGSALHREAWNWAQVMVDPDRPSEWNQAIMELGATVCTPRNPQCESCPLGAECVGKRQGLASMLPIRPPKLETLTFEFRVWAPIWKGKWGLRQIVEGPWWRGMWEFPRTESDERPAWAQSARLSATLPAVCHTVTRNRIRFEPRLLVLRAPAAGLRWTRPEELEALPMSSPQRKILSLALAAVNRSPAEG